jgi:secreted PhoX family phosphatase
VISAILTETIRETITEETMTVLSRRSILAGAAAGAASTAFSWNPLAFALAPAAGKQAASFYR